MKSWLQKILARLADRCGVGPKALLDLPGRAITIQLDCDGWLNVHYLDMDADYGGRIVASHVLPPQGLIQAEKWLRSGLFFR